MAAPSSKHNKDPKTKIEMRSRLKYNIEDKMSIEQIGKEFEGKKDQIKDNIMKILRIFILMIVSTSKKCVLNTSKNSGLNTLKKSILTSQKSVLSNGLKS